MTAELLVRLEPSLLNEIKTAAADLDEPASLLVRRGVRREIARIRAGEL